MGKFNTEPFSIENTKLEVWFERDRAYVGLENLANDKTILEFWDEAVWELFEDGFLKSNAILGKIQKNDPKLHRSLYDYAVCLGYIKPRQGGVVKYIKKKKNSR